jgi:signal peptidase I
MLSDRIANPYLRSLVEWLIAGVLAVLFFLIMRFFIFRVAHVTGSSMEPTLAHGDIVVLNRLGWLISGPRVGDIVAFPYQSDPGDNFIKRVVAVPGDEVDLRDGAFYVNGERLEDDFSHELIEQRGDAARILPLIVPEGTVFVLGDNRNGSKDSRFATVGNVPISDVVGRVAVRVWPMRTVGRV